MRIVIDAKQGTLNYRFLSQRDCQVSIQPILLDGPCLPTDQVTSSRRKPANTDPTQNLDISTKTL